ncbi:hypothetical protein AGR13a_Lc30109 [Agrobacterium genomosp. 13 str. CFBP 6927]|uniref:Uncharacterized protein n=1 Tax=Agrobacterium genomosp. 13 str. CFBP 6927 TaxID=1183428 RepID=A0ABM9VLD4_9HYPH|nr:hypothetical protein AGR13a_Lc30109 [Agrobacterium genomosp. 13 str. CFBP 6927]
MIVVDDFVVEGLVIEDGALN